MPWKHPATKWIKVIIKKKRQHVEPLTILSTKVVLPSRHVDLEHCCPTGSLGPRTPELCTSYLGRSSRPHFYNGTSSILHAFLQGYLDTLPLQGGSRSPPLGSEWA